MLKRISKQLTVVFLLLFAWQQPAMAATPDLAQRIDDIVKSVMQKGPYPGMVIAVEKDGDVIYNKGHGFADLENNVAMTPDAVFAVGSVTKSFTGLAIMQLVEAGKVSLDAPVSTYLPDYPEPGRSIAIRHLLNHTSGIPNYVHLPEFPKNPRRDYTHEEMLAFFQTKPLLFAPGTAFSYSNSNTYLLGMIIEKVSGKDYPTYVADNILKPLDLQNTYYGDYTRLIKNRVSGYKPAAGGFVNATQYSPTVPFSAGAMMSTAADLLKYRRGVFESAAVSAEVRKLITTRDKLITGEVVSYALGCLVVDKFEGHAKISHAGDVFGFSAHYAYYPDDNVTIAVLTNGQGATMPPVSIEHKVAREVLGIAQPAIRNLVPTETELQKWSGTFEIKPFQFGPPHYGFVAKDGKLHLQYGGVGSGAPLLPLLYQGKGRFVSAIDDEHVFEFDRKGKKFTASYYDGHFSGYRVEK